MIYAILDENDIVENVIVADEEFVKDMKAICIDGTELIGIGSKWGGNDWIPHKDTQVAPLSFEEIDSMLEKLKNEYNG